MTFKIRGRQVTQSGAIFTMALCHSADGWRIAAWAGAKGQPSDVGVQHGAKAPRRTFVLGKNSQSCCSPFHQNSVAVLGDDRYRWLIRPSK
jgi:hypothetical protein